MRRSDCDRCRRTLWWGQAGDAAQRALELLRARGHRVVCSSDSNDAQVPDTDPGAPGLVLVDLTGAPADGLAEIRRRKADRTCDRQVVIAFAPPAQLEAALHAGADDLVAADSPDALLACRIAMAERALSTRCLRDAAEESVSQVNANLRALIENTDDFILFSDRTGSPVIFNSAYARVMRELLGIDMRTGLKPHELLPDAAARAAWDGYHRRVLSGERFKIEYEQPTDGATSLFLEVSYNPVVQGGEIIGFSEFSRDITERKLAERAIQQANSCLERKVAERTAELRDANLALSREIETREATEQRLRRAEKLEALGQLAGGIAHDFNNQLVGIMGFADLIRRATDDDAETHRYASAIMKATERSADLVENLLAFARKGKQQSAPVNVHDVIGEVVALLERSVDKRITIERRLDASSTVITGDQALLHSALLNLAINARDAMPGGGTITFATDVVELDDHDCDRHERRVQPGAHLRVVVRDTGPGIDDELIGRIFDPFFTSKESGTGMGLAAVYGALRSHHGTVSVSAPPGDGAAFELLLPLAGVDETSAGAPRETTPRGAGAHVLVIDDEPMVREVLATVLTSLGHTVETVDDAELALQRYRDTWRTVDLVIFDMVMPKLDGAEMFAEMRRINPQVRGLLSSGYSLRRGAHNALGDAVCGVLPKPYGVDEIEAAVGRALAAPAG